MVALSLETESGISSTSPACPSLTFVFLPLGTLISLPPTSTSTVPSDTATSVEVEPSGSWSTFTDSAVPRTIATALTVSILKLDAVSNNFLTRLHVEPSSWNNIMVVDPSTSLINSSTVISVSGSNRVELPSKNVIRARPVVEVRTRSPTLIVISGVVTCSPFTVTESVTTVRLVIAGKTMEAKEYEGKAKYSNTGDKATAITTAIAIFPIFTPILLLSCFLSEQEFVPNKYIKQQREMQLSALVLLWRARHTANRSTVHSFSYHLIGITAGQRLKQHFRLVHYSTSILNSMLDITLRIGI